MRILTMLAVTLATLFAAPAMAEDDPVAAAVEAIANYDETGAGTILDTACKAGNVEACWRRGLLYANDYSDEAKTAADKQFLANCAKNEPRSCYMIFKRTAYDASEKDKARGRVALGKACDGGLAYACADYANAIEYDEATKGDRAAIARAYEKACTLGSTSACHGAAGYFGDIFDETPLKNLTKAAMLEGKACDMGNADACGNLPAIEAAMLDDGASATVEMERRWQGLREKACMIDGSRCEEFLQGQLTAK